MDSQIQRHREPFGKYPLTLMFDNVHLGISLLRRSGIPQASQIVPDFKTVSCEANYSDKIATM